MKKHFYTLLFLCMPFALLAQVQVTKAYIEKYKTIAMQEMKRTGVPASITLAQAIVESSSGESNLAKKFNNHFGIKCKLDWKGETTYQDDDTKKECFRVYSDAILSFKDHSDFLKNRPNYASLFELDPVDDSAWAIGLKKAGYATASDYPKKLLKVIDDYELSQYNFPSIAAEADNTDSVKAPVTQPAIIKDSVVKDTIKTNVDTVKTAKPAPIVTAIQDTIKLSSLKGIGDNNTNLTKVANPQSIHKISDLPKDSTSNASVLITITKKKLAPYPKAKFKINGVPVIWAKEGRSFLEIASTYKISLYKLYVYNDMKETDLVENDQLIFLASKKKESNKKVHIVKAGETLYDISQSEGVQLEHLKTYNPQQVNNKTLTEGTNLILFHMPGDKKRTTYNDYSIKVKLNLFKNWHLFKKKK